MENYIIYPKQLRRRVIPVEKNRCFFLMPFSHDFDIIYGTVKKHLINEGIVCNRADEIAGSTPVISKILTEITKAQYVIVDLTNSNPNVYYELGITHTIKEARNVLLIKQKDYKVPFDITHLTYIEYEPSNLLLLVSTIISFIKSNQESSTFYEALNLNRIIGYTDDNNNDYIEYFQSQATGMLPLINKALLGESNELSISQIKELITVLHKIIHDIVVTPEKKLSLQVMNICFHIISHLPENNDTKELVEYLLDDYYCEIGLSDDFVRELKTQLALTLAKKELHMHTVLPWIIQYFSRTKSTTIDLNRYNIEKFLMTTDIACVNEAIINSLCNSNCYIREHMSDIVGEKKLVDGFELLCVQLMQEKNYFSAQSMIEALGKLKVERGIEFIIEWVHNNKTDIIKTNQLFVLKHAFIAISSLDNSLNHKYAKQFSKEFGEILKDYYII